MTKTFNKDSILQIEDYFVVVDKETEPDNRKLCLCYHKETGSPNIEDYYADDKEYYVHKPDKIIATIGKRIGDVPLIELPDEIYGREILKLWGKNDRKLSGVDAYRAYEAGVIDGYTYKANKGRYSEEDMWGVLHMLLRLTKFQDQEVAMYRYLKSLQTKRPIKVVLEYETFRSPTETEKVKQLFLGTRPKVSEGNIIKPLEVEYE